MVEREICELAAHGFQSPAHLRLAVRVAVEEQVASAGSEQAPGLDPGEVRGDPAEEVDIVLDRADF